jgi:DNA invertase Pin-like site-specific DNA recombinase
MTVFGYARVSTTDQSLEQQIAELRHAGCTVVRSEQKSGGSMEGRDEIQIIMDFMQPGDVLIVTKLDRLARNTLDTLRIIETLGKMDCGFKSLAEPWADTTSAVGKLVITVMAGVAEFERARIRERQLLGIAAAKAKGLYKGRKRTVKPEDVRKLAAEGVGPTAIAKQLGCSRQSVYRALEANSPSA